MDGPHGFRQSTTQPDSMHPSRPHLINSNTPLSPPPSSDDPEQPNKLTAYAFTLPRPSSTTAPSPYTSSPGPISSNVLSSPTNEHYPKAPSRSPSPLSSLFPCTHTEPKIYFLPLPSTLANQRLDALESATSRSWNPKRDHERHYHRSGRPRQGKWDQNLHIAAENNKKEYIHNDHSATDTPRSTSDHRRDSTQTTQRETTTDRTTDRSDRTTDRHRHKPTRLSVDKRPRSRPQSQSPSPAQRIHHTAESDTLDLLRRSTFSDTTSGSSVVDAGAEWGGGGAFTSGRPSGYSSGWSSGRFSGQGSGGRRYSPRKRSWREEGTGRREEGRSRREAERGDRRW
ncbi:hypothetical protein BDZ85DRAFT_253093 [Elsinoe ampelina]|uniref:Uncharacterized protein n=1 Tax=Elsinoe ampelina TaxID=302913 RepID=A0A6A6G039_9PEZI|nr:hypothetical protein BDZ85DRAFT_253093 [Elsinoe ampelina]